METRNIKCITYFPKLKICVATYFVFILVHLGERLSINDVGELYLSAPVNSGLYTFQVVATTIFTHEIGTAMVRLGIILSRKLSNSLS